MSCSQLSPTFCTHPTGAVRSNDLAQSRWDLISGAAVRLLRESSSLQYYDRSPFTLVNEAIEYAQRFLGYEHEGEDPYENRLRLLGIGWFSLAAAIQILDSTPEQFDLMKSRILSSNYHYPYWALSRLAATCDEGARKYGEENWLRGFQVKGLMNHGICHMVRWTNGFDIEDELGHAMWSFMATAHMMIFRRDDMCKLLLGQNYSITSEIQAMHDRHISREL